MRKRKRNRYIAPQGHRWTVEFDLTAAEIMSDLDPGWQSSAEHRRVAA